MHHIGCAFSIYIEKHDEYGPAPHGFGKLSAFLVTHISWRRPNQTGRRESCWIRGSTSLAIAILVTRLEDTLGLDPFTESEDASPPVTLGDFIRFYENAANLSAVDPGQAG